MIISAVSSFKTVDGRGLVPASCCRFTSGRHYRNTPSSNPTTASIELNTAISLVFTKFFFGTTVVFVVVVTSGATTTTTSVSTATEFQFGDKTLSKTP